MPFYAYIYSDPVTYEHFYVGRGSRDRARSHMAPRGSHNAALNSRIAKLKAAGLKPIVTIIETSTTQFASMLEVGLIKQFGRKSLGTGTLYNLTDGGEDLTGRIRTEEQKRKTSETLKKFYKTNKMVCLPETAAKISATKAKHPTGTGKWMNNGIRQAKVKLEDVAKFLADGWVFGIRKVHVTDAYKAKLSAAAKAQWAKVKNAGHTSTLIKVEE